MSYLFVVSHPDDEILGAGATIFNLARKGEDVFVCVLSEKVLARTHRPSDAELMDSLHQSEEILGIKNVYLGDFPNIMFNTVPHLELVQFVEKAMVDCGADVIVTHHPNDTNNDHLHTSLAVQAAIRLFQRRPEVKPIKDVLYMEVASSTEWGVNLSMNPFIPNTFVEVKKEGVDKKIEALSLYKDVMRPFPHPRSAEAITGLAAYRGSQSGCDYAEAFESAFRRIIIN